MEQAILCLNGGSSSLKFAVYRIFGQDVQRAFSGAVEAIGAANGRTWLRAGSELLADQSGIFPDHAQAIKTMFAALQNQGTKNLLAVGHRIVQGGPAYTAPQRVDARLKSTLQDLIPLAPLHLPSQVAMIDAVTAAYPELPQVACFDTAFHASMPDRATRFALPRDLWQRGIRRYGFHGLSYEFVVGKLAGELGRRAVIAHLGNGASMAALKDGAPIDTSMGMTPTGGFMMGTRCGDLDPGVLLHLMRKGYSADQFEELLDHQSGLLGVSGLTSEMKVLLEKRETDAEAALAVEMFCYQARKFIGSYAAALGGMDTLVFTGGIGEHASEIRAEICRGLEHLGIQLDPAANDRGADIISTGDGTCVVRVVKTDEDLMIARHTLRLIAQEAR